MKRKDLKGPERRFKELFNSVPSLDDLHTLDIEGLRPNVIVVDAYKDKKLSCYSSWQPLWQWASPAAMVKKISGLVCDFFKRPNSESDPVEGALEEASHSLKNQGIHMLGQIKHSSCHSRSILFKVLADTIWLECRLTVQRQCFFLIYLLAIVILQRKTHTIPIEPNSPLCGFSDQIEVEDPEHTFFRGHERSMLGGHSHNFREYNDANASRCKDHIWFLCKSAGASPIETAGELWRESTWLGKSLRQFNTFGSYTSFFVEQINSSRSCSTSENDDSSDLQESVSKSSLDDHDGMYGQKLLTDIFRSKQKSTHKAISLPSSHHFSNQASTESESTEVFASSNMMSTFDKVLESSTIWNKPLLPFQEWNIDFSEITIGTRVGIGLFGEVFRGTWNGLEVGIKVFLEQDPTVENIEDFCNEISILSRIRHPNVILFLGACSKPPCLSVVTEYMEMGSLYFLMHSSGLKKKLSWQRRLKMLCDICRGLMHIHRMKIAHRDLKSANCLVNKHWAVKICDFGLSRRLTTRSMKDSSAAGTPEWMAPELIRNEPFTERCDIFSLGVIIWELCTLKKPWEGIPSVKVVYAVAIDGQRLEIPEGPLSTLIADCWAEPDKRPSCREVLSRLQDCERSLV